ncbi:NUDIX hydrolase [Streptomyces sp. NPDC058239]|uniref:NUDIX hydrolase n=1 Tax=unclassified Streptomyces TaxID=2593676 RepID=UPI003654EFEC
MVERSPLRWTRTEPGGDHDPDSADGPRQPSVPEPRRRFRNIRIGAGRVESGLHRAGGGHRAGVTDSVAPPLAVDDLGNALTSFVSGREGAPPGDAPLPFALVALWHRRRVLMVFDRFRQSWELPGGRIEQGESPRQAAVRELLEETGQVPDGKLRFAGYAGFTLAPGRRAEYGALFAGCSAGVLDFQQNEEIVDIRWWDLREALPGRVQLLDAHLARLTWDPAFSRPTP